MIEDHYNKDMMEQILEWHRKNNIEMIFAKAPYSLDVHLEHLISDIKDDGHRAFRMFVQNPDNDIVEHRGWLCLCGIFVDLEYNPESYFRVGQCGVDFHAGCEVLLPEGIKAPYLLSEDYRKHVRPAITNYIPTQITNDDPDWECYICRNSAIKEMQEYLTV